MPHTSRRKPKPVSNKLIKVTADDGWSVISRRSNAQQQPQISRLKSEKLDDSFDPLNHSSDETYFERIHERLTLPQVEQLRKLAGSNGNETATVLILLPAQCSQAELELRFDETKRSWRASGMNERIAAILDAHVDEHSLRGIEKAVCLGLGSLSVDKFAWKRTNMWQIVAFLEVVQIISRQSKAVKITLYAQEPRFNSVDKSFLADHGISVVESPAAFTEINANTFVFAPHYPVTWWPSTMRSSSASSLIIGNDVEKALPRIPDRQELARIFRLAGGGISESDIEDLNMRGELADFLEMHESLAFPDIEETQHAFIDLRVYWDRMRL